LISDEVTDKNKLAPFYGPRCRMWADAQRDGRPAEYRWRPLTI